MKCFLYLSIIFAYLVDYYYIKFFEFCYFTACVLPCVFVVMLGMKVARNSVFKVEWGLPEIAPKYRKQLAEIVNAYWVDQSPREEYQRQASTVFINACKSDHVKFPKEAALDGSTTSIAQNTGLDRRVISKATSHPEQVIFYEYMPYYIVSLGDDVYITDLIDDFSQPYLRVDLPKAVRVQNLVLTLF
jgi:hypothetical protein